MFEQIVTALPHVRSGKLRGLAVTSSARTTVAPEIPTIAESGLPGYSIVTWHGLQVPAATPRPLVARLNAEAVKALGSAEVRERFIALGAEPAPSTPEQFRTFIQSETEKWGKVVRAAGLKAE
jgi:tripartite-type tricarboxylate transporter receptor subunit TctC